MEKVFRTTLVDQISIKLDKEGLDGLDVKEELVLISDQIVQLNRQVISSSESLGQKVVEGNELLRQDIKAVHQDIQLIRQDIQLVRQDIQSIHQGLQLIRQDIQLIHQELVDFRKKIGFWVKVLITGVWGVVASLIANLIFQVISR